MLSRCPGSVRLTYAGIHPSHLSVTAFPSHPICCCYLEKLNERRKCWVRCDRTSIQDFRWDKPFSLRRVLWMNSTFIDTLLISLVLFGLLRNWRQVFTSCCNGRKENRSFSSPCHEQKYTTSLAARLQHTWLPGCFFTGLSNYLPVVSWEHF